MLFELLDVLLGGFDRLEDGLRFGRADDLIEGAIDLETAGFKILKD